MKLRQIISEQLPDDYSTIFYHGTASHVLDDILRDGLRPSEQTGVGGLDGEDIDPSKVYLSNNLSYAVTAATVFSDWTCIEHGSYPVILAVDMSSIDPNSFLPDDNYGKTWQDTYRSGGGISIEGTIDPDKLSVFATAKLICDGQPAPKFEATYDYRKCYWQYKTVDEREFQEAAHIQENRMSK